MTDLIRALITLRAERQLSNFYSENSSEISRSDSSIIFEQLPLSELSERDIEEISTLEMDLFGAGAWSAEAVEQELSAPARSYFVARDDKIHGGENAAIVGYAGLWFDGDDAEIMTIGVSRSYQGQHIGTELMNLLKTEAQRLGAARILLEVAVDNEPALALYRAAGFEQLGIRKRYYQPENKDAYTMACALNGPAKNPVGFSV